MLRFPTNLQNKHLWTLVESLLKCPEENEAFEYVLSVQQSRLTEDAAGNPELVMETILTSSA